MKIYIPNLKDIEDCVAQFCAAQNITPGVFGNKLFKDTQWFKRLQQEKVGMRNVNRALKFIRETLDNQKNQ